MNNLAFSKINYILLVVGFAIIVLGFILMGGGATSEEAFNPEIFSDLHIKAAPMVCLFGFLFEFSFHFLFFFAFFVRFGLLFLLKNNKFFTIKKKRTKNLLNAN